MLGKQDVGIRAIGRQLQGLARQRYPPTRMRRLQRLVHHLLGRFGRIGRFARIGRGVLGAPPSAGRELPALPFELLAIVGRAL
jgi:hypothetical protein